MKPPRYIITLNICPITKSSATSPGEFLIGEPAQIVSLGSTRTKSKAQQVVHAIVSAVKTSPLYEPLEIDEP